MKQIWKRAGWILMFLAVIGLIALIVAGNQLNQPDPQDLIAASGNHAKVGS